MSYNFDDDHEMEFPFRGIPGHIQNMYTDLLAVIETLRAVIEDNYDEREKRIGDRIVVWDGSSLTRLNGEEIYLNESPFTERDYFIVVDEFQDHTLTFSLFGDDETEDADEYLAEKIEESDITYLQDLVIVDPDTNEKYRVSSEHVKRLDDLEK